MAYTMEFLKEINFTPSKIVNSCRNQSVFLLEFKKTFPEFDTTEIVTLIDIQVQSSQDLPRKLRSIWSFFSS